MAKKTISDLKIGDIIYRFEGIGKIQECRIQELSERHLVVLGYKFLLEPGENTSFKFKKKPSNGHYEYTFLLDRIDALKMRRVALDANFQEIFKKQEDWFLKIQQANDAIRNCDNEIAKEIIK